MYQVDVGHNCALIMAVILWLSKNFGNRICAGRQCKLQKENLSASWFIVYSRARMCDTAFDFASRYQHLTTTLGVRYFSTIYFTY